MFSLTQSKKNSNLKYTTLLIIFSKSFNLHLTEDKNGPEVFEFVLDFVHWGFEICKGTQKLCKTLASTCKTKIQIR